MGFKVLDNKFMREIFHFFKRLGLVAVLASVSQASTVESFDATGIQWEQYGTGSFSVVRAVGGPSTASRGSVHGVFVCREGLCYEVPTRSMSGSSKERSYNWGHSGNRFQNEMVFAGGEVTVTCGKQSSVKLPVIPQEKPGSLFIAGQRSPKFLKLPNDERLLTVFEGGGRRVALVQRAFGYYSNTQYTRVGTNKIRTFENTGEGWHEVASDGVRFDPRDRLLGDDPQRSGLSNFSLSYPGHNFNIKLDPSYASESYHRVPAAGAAIPASTRARVLYFDNRANGYGRIKSSPIRDEFKKTMSDLEALDPDVEFVVDDTHLGSHDPCSSAFRGLPGKGKVGDTVN
jgi:hypothetical protein